MSTDAGMPELCGGAWNIRALSSAYAESIRLRSVRALALLRARVERVPTLRDQANHVRSAVPASSRENFS